MTRIKILHNIEIRVIRSFILNFILLVLLVNHISLSSKYNGEIVKQETKQKRNETKRDTTETKQDKAETKRNEKRHNRNETKPKKSSITNLEKRNKH